MSGRRSVSVGGRPVAAGLVVWWTITGCAGNDWFDPASDTEVGPVEIVVDLQATGRWTASGPLVDSGALCPSGRRHEASWRDAVTDDELQMWEVARLEDALTGPTDRADIVTVVEHVCHDGSGAFVVAENQERGDWQVVDGTGRYAEVTGGGTLSFVVDMAARPSELYVVAELTFGGEDS